MDKCKACKGMKYPFTDKSVSCPHCRGTGEEPGTIGITSMEDKVAACNALRYADVGPVAKCKACGGVGRRAYPSSATWRRGVGGMTMTDGVCDKCWGSGTTAWTGVDQRKMEAAFAALREAGERMAERAAIQASLLQDAVLDARVREEEMRVRLEKAERDLAWERTRDACSHCACEGCCTVGGGEVCDGPHEECDHHFDDCEPDPDATITRNRKDDPCSSA